MPEIYPKLTRRQLQQSAKKTVSGKKRSALPGVKTDVKHVRASDKCGNQANRELSRMIKKAVKSKKLADKDGAHFVLGWRLYPNNDHPRWNSKDVHSCGCGCGCSA